MSFIQANNTRTNRISREHSRLAWRWYLSQHRSPSH